MPRRVQNDGRLHVVRRLPDTQVRRPGIVGHRAHHPREIITVEGLPVVGPADTWVDFGELIGRGKPIGVDDVIILGDAIATMLNDVAPLRAALDRRNRPRGKRTHQEALKLIRVGSRSPRETMCRIMFMRVGLPEPHINQPVYAETNPTVFLGMPDFSWQRMAADGTLTKVAGEYQSFAFHSDPGKRVQDGERRTGFESDGWKVEWIWASDLRTLQHRRLTCMRFARALQLPVERLDLTQCDSRFFSEYRLAEIGRHQERWSRRSA